MKRHSYLNLMVGILGLCWTMQGLVPSTSWAISKLDSYEAGTIRNGVTIAKLRQDQFVTAVRLSDGRLKLITWKVNPESRTTLTRLKSYTAGRIADHGVALDAFYGTSGRFVTAVRLPNDDLKVIDWYVDEAGMIYRLSSVYPGHSPEAGVHIPDKVTDIGVREFHYYHSIRSSTITRHIVVAARVKETGKLKLYSIVQQTNQDIAGGLKHVDSYTAGSIRSNGFNRILALARVQGQSPVTAVRLTNENLKIIAWNISPGTGRITRTGDWTAGRVLGVDITRGHIMNGPANSAPDFMTACRLKDGKLKMIGWELVDGQPIRRDDLKTTSTVTEAALGAQAYADDFVVAHVNNAVLSGSARLRTFSLGDSGVLSATGSVQLLPAMRDVAVVQTQGVSSDGTVVRYALVAGQKPSSDPNQGNLVLSVWDVRNGHDIEWSFMDASQTTEDSVPGLPIPYPNIAQSPEIMDDSATESISFNYNKIEWGYGTTSIN